MCLIGIGGDRGPLCSRLGCHHGGRLISELVETESNGFKVRNSLTPGFVAEIGSDTSNNQIQMKPFEYGLNYIGRENPLAEIVGGLSELKM